MVSQIRIDLGGDLVVVRVDGETAFRFEKRVLGAHPEIKGALIDLLYALIEEALEGKKGGED